MKGLPLPSDFGGKGVLDLELLVKNKAFFTAGAEGIPAFNSSYFLKKNCFLSSNNGFGEPTSVLDSTISGGNTTSSTPSSSHGGGGSGGGGGASTDTAGVGAVSEADPSPISSNAGGAESDLLPVPPCLEFGANGGGVGGSALENLFSTLPPAQEQSIFRWIMGDAGEESTMGNVSRSLQIGVEGPSASEFEFSGGFGIVDPGDPFGPNSLSAGSSLPNRSGAEKTGLPSDLLQPPAFYSSSELKPLVFNPNNPHQARHTPNPSFFIPLHNEQSSLGPPQAKRPNVKGFVNGCLGPNWSYTDAHQELQQPQQLHHHLQLLPHYLPPQVPTRPGPNLIIGPTDEPVQIQTIINQMYNVAELIQTGNFILAQGILARLNHFLSPAGKSYIRAAFYCKEALESLLVMNNNVDTDTRPPSDLILKIAAYKSFSEISPLVEFSNFSRNQALLEAFEGLDRIHIVDFDIGLGGQWASLMQELALRGEARPALKITALVPPRHLGHTHLELCLVRENLFQFAGEINIEFEFEVSSIDLFRVSGNEAVGVNLPIYCLAEYDLPLPLVLRFVKQMSPRVVVTADGGCELTDLPFAGHVVRNLQSCLNLLESIDAVGLDLEGVQRIERFLIGPRMAKSMVGHFRRPGKLGHWRDMFASSGFSQVGFSDFAGFQGECIVKRARARGFQLEKRRPSTFVLSWMHKELMSVSVWRC